MNTEQVNTERVSTALSAAILWSLRPRGWRARLRWRLAGGLTVAQIADRLDSGLRHDLGPGADDRVREALAALVVQGRVCRRAVSIQVEMVAKGRRDVIVDVYRHCTRRSTP